MTFSFSSSDDGVWRLHLNDLAGRNRIGSSRMAEMHAALDDLVAKRDARVLVISGLPEAFCSGFDLTELADSPGEVGARVLAFGRLCDRIASLALVTIAEVDGPAFGGGVDLVSSCRFRLATRRTALCIPATSMGLHYHPGGVRRLVQHFGVGLSRWLLLTSLPLRGEQLKTCGFFHHMAEETVELQTLVATLAQRLANASPSLIQDIEASIYGYAVQEGSSCSATDASVEARVLRSARSEELHKALEKWNRRQPA